MNTPASDELLRFPIGKAQLPDGPLTAAERTALIQQIAELPAQLTAAARAAGGARAVHVVQHHVLHHLNAVGVQHGALGQRRRDLAGGQVRQVGDISVQRRLLQRIGRANHRLDEPSRALLVPANRFEVLECQAALDAVEAAVRVLEDNEHFNAGRGSSLTRQGEVEMDAAIMDGRTRQAGAVTALRYVQNPISAARAVLEHSAHVCLEGAGALELALEQGLPLRPPSYFETEKTKQEWLELVQDGTLHEQRHDTVGAVALDQAGNLAVATSTGGLEGQAKGRVGDSPVLGAGTYASNEACAVSCTGDGEVILRGALAHEVYALVKYKNLPLAEACREALRLQADEVAVQRQRDEPAVEHRAEQVDARRPVGRLPGEHFRRRQPVTQRAGVRFSQPHHAGGQTQFQAILPVQKVLRVEVGERAGEVDHRAVEVVDAARAHAHGELQWRG